MAEPNVLKSVVDNIVPLSVGVMASFAAAYGTFVTMRFNQRKQNTDHWSALQQAQTAFFGEVREELHATKQENAVLRKQNSDLETKISELLRNNETLLAEKLDWMQRAMSLQMIINAQNPQAVIPALDLHSATRFVETIKQQSEGRNEN